jgi:hypothetical protein
MSDNPVTRRVMLGATVLGLLVGCSATPKPSADPVEPPPMPDAAVLEAMIARHNHRIDQLSHVASVGVLELRWIDGQGKERFEPQLNARLWFEQPRRTALRLEKLGNVLFWLGSDDERFWLFNRLDDPKRLYRGHHDRPVVRHMDFGFPVQPLALLDLFGLARIPAGTTPEAAPEGGWAFHVPGSGGTVRVVLDAATGLPTAVELVGADGKPGHHADLGRYRSVAVSGTAAAALPKFPTMIDITDAARGTRIKLALGQSDDKTFDRVFDLEGLEQHLRPDVIEQMTASLPGEPQAKASPETE